LSEALLQILHVFENLKFERTCHKASQGRYFLLFYATSNKIGITSAELSGSSPIRLLNQAWQQFVSEPTKYPSWEKKSIEFFLNNAR